MIHTAAFNEFFLTSKNLAPSFWATSAVLVKGNWEWKPNHSFDPKDERELGV